MYEGEKFIPANLNTETKATNVEGPKIKHKHFHVPTIEIISMLSNMLQVKDIYFFYELKN